MPRPVKRDPGTFVACKPHVSSVSDKSRSSFCRDLAGFRSRQLVVEVIDRVAIAPEVLERNRCRARLRHGAKQSSLNGWTILDGVDHTLRLDRKNTCVFDARPKGSDLIWLSVNHANAQLGKHDGVSAPEVLGGRTGLEISRARNAQPRYAAEHCSTGIGGFGGV